jgi:hypothetical protein
MGAIIRSKKARTDSGDLFEAKRMAEWRSLLGSACYACNFLISAAVEGFGRL